MPFIDHFISGPLSEIVQIPAIRRTNVKSGKFHLQLGAFGRAAHWADKVRGRFRKRSEADKRPSLSVGGYLHPDYAVTHGGAHPDVRRIAAITSRRPIRAIDGQNAA